MTTQPFTGWRKSTYSPNNSDCVEIGTAPEVCGIRDSKLGDASPILSVRAEAFAALLDRLR